MPEAELEGTIGAHKLPELKHTCAPCFMVKTTAEARHRVRATEMSDGVEALRELWFGADVCQTWQKRERANT